MEQENGARIHVGTLTDGIMRLDAEESAHCIKVLRHVAGDTINAIDGSGTLYHCRIVVASAKGVEAEIIGSEPDFGTHPYRLTMAVCPTKNIDRYEWFVEKATEIGVDCIVPVFGDRSERKVIKTDRIRKIAISASKQSLKGTIPEIAEPVTVKEFLDKGPDAGLKMICYCFDDVKLRKSILQVLDAADNEVRDVCILVGPEGDFSREEVSLAMEKGWTPVHLGDSRLRTETAAVVAATAVYFHYKET